MFVVTCSFEEKHTQSEVYVYTQLKCSADTNSSCGKVYLWHNIHTSVTFISHHDNHTTVIHVQLTLFQRVCTFRGQWLSWWNTWTLHWPQLKSESELRITALHREYHQLIQPPVKLEHWSLNLGDCGSVCRGERLDRDNKVQKVALMNWTHIRQC